MELTALRCSSVRTATASQITKRVCPAAHPPTPRPALLGAYRREWERLGSSLRSTPRECQYRRGAGALVGPSEAMARACSGSLLPVPRSGARAGRMRVGARMPRELTRRGCPNGAALQRSEFHGGPACASIAGCPVAQAKGTRAVGAPFLCLLSFGEAKESECAAGRTPRPREAVAQQHSKMIAACAHHISARCQFDQKKIKPEPSRLFQSAGGLPWSSAHGTETKPAHPLPARSHACSCRSPSSTPAPAHHGPPPSGR